MTVGERIKQRRKELGYNAEYLANILGVSRSTMYRYENGDIEKLPTDVLEPLAKALQTTPAYLMGWVEISTATVHKEGISEPRFGGYMREEDFLAPYTPGKKKILVSQEHLKNAEELLALFSNLSDENQKEILEFAKYLKAKNSIEKN